MKYEVKLYRVCPTPFKQDEKFIYRYIAKRIYAEAPTQQQLLELFLQYFYDELKKFHESNNLDSHNWVISNLDYKFIENNIKIKVQNTRKRYGERKGSYYWEKDSHLFSFEILKMYEKDDKECYSLNTHENKEIRDFANRISKEDNNPTTKKLYWKDEYEGY